MVSPRSQKIVSLSADGKPTAVYPSIAAAALILGVSRQAIAQAIADGSCVKGLRFQKLYTYQKEHSHDSRTR